jgi:hypothetical protein
MGKMAVDTVWRKPLSASNSLLTGKYAKSLASIE